MINRFMIVALLAAAVAGCGHSEDEWQAQLAKYNDLAKRCEADRAELAKERDRVKALEQELADMGVKLKEMDSLRASVEDYKQRAAMLEKIKARYETLRNKLKKLTELGLKVEIRRNRMVISLPGDVLFASGKDELRDDGKNILKQVADVVRADSGLASRQYQVAGHTDNKPFKNATFKDNWGLSLMRARGVLVYLTSPTDDKEGGGGLNVNNWSASGYGETDPIADNTTDEGRQKNRRVELILMPDVEEMLDLKSLI